MVLVYMANTMVYVNIFRKGQQTLIACCDQEILGKTFKHRRLKLEVKKSFYKGTLMSVDDAIKILARADIANLCGDNIVSAVVEEGFADPRAVIWISDTPHLQFIKM